MKHLITRKFLVLPNDVEVIVLGRTVTVTGPRGSLFRDFNHSNAKLKIVNTSKGKKLVVSCMNRTSKVGAVCRSVCTTVDKMITGVTIGYSYKMKLVYAHFPINIKIKDDNKCIEIRNFVGEKRPRICQMIGESTTVSETDQKDEIQVCGNDLVEVSQSAARIHTQCLVRKKDIRKFLDGVYVWAKGPIGEEKVV